VPFHDGITESVAKIGAAKSVSQAKAPRLEPKNDPNCVETFVWEASSNEHAMFEWGLLSPELFPQCSVKRKLFELHTERASIEDFGLHFF
jgi:hypothetical protein